MRDKVREFSQTGRKISGPPIKPVGRPAPALAGVIAGCTYIETDYSGLELRIVAHLFAYRKTT